MLVNLIIWTLSVGIRCNFSEHDMIWSGDVFTSNLTEPRLCAILALGICFEAIEKVDGFYRTSLELFFTKDYVGSKMFLPTTPLLSKKERKIKIKKG